MKYLKKYESFDYSVNEEFISKEKITNWFINVKRLVKREGIETRITAKILIKLIKYNLKISDKKVTEEEIKFLKDHSKDLLKILPFIVAAPSPIPYVSISIMLKKFGINVLPSKHDLEIPASYKKLESIDSVISIDDIKDDFYDIFLPVKDICHVKLSVAPAPSVVHVDLQTNPTYNFSVSLNLDNRVVAIEDQVKSKYGQKYRSVINGDEIMCELSSAIERCFDMGLFISSAQVCWVNAGEWGLRYRSDVRYHEINKNNSNMGPGLISKFFSNKEDKRAEKFPMEYVVKGHYPPEMLPDFLIEKGDRVRMVKITFEYNI